MENIYAMLERVDFLNEIRENERRTAAEKLYKEVCAFVAHYGYACTSECPSTWRTYVLLNDGLILRKKEDDDEGETLEVNSLSLGEMEFLHGFMVESINHDSEYIKDEIERYIDLYQ